MTAPATLDRPVRATLPGPSHRVGTGAPTSRPGRRDGRGYGPQARPARPAQLRRSLRHSGPQSCSVSVPRAATAGWQLTERGIAVVLVAGLMIMVAALTVVGLTALRVTGDGYVSGTHARLR